jgi:membrane protein YdbS with pleckstrin-like domain
MLKTDNNENKLTLKVCFLYGLYKQSLSIIATIGIILLTFMLQKITFNEEQKAIVLNSLYLLCLLFIIRIIYGLIYFKTLKYILFKDRLVTKKGVFTNQFSFLELYRVTDYEVYQSFFMRLFNIMNLQLITSDKTDPILNLKGIPKSDVFQLIRENVEEQRRIKGVREFD